MSIEQIVAGQNKSFETSSGTGKVKIQKTTYGFNRKNILELKDEKKCIEPKRMN